MRKETCVKILREMNRWRRGEKPYDGVAPQTCRQMPYTPKEFGDAIDEAIKILETIKDKYGKNS